MRTPATGRTFMQNVVRLMQSRVGQRLLDVGPVLTTSTGAGPLSTMLLKEEVERKRTTTKLIA